MRNNKKFKQGRDANAIKRGTKGRGKQQEYVGINPDMKSGTCGNDFAWYSKNRGVVDTMGSVFFNTLYGYPRKSFNVDLDGSFTYLENEANTAIPGVVVAQFIPWVAAKGTDSDAINVASQNLYTWLRHANSGSVNYERSDLIQYLLAVGNIYMLIEVLKRDIRLITSYNPRNKYVFNALLEGLGYNSAGLNDLRDNIANYTASLNLLIQKTSTLVIPNNIPFIQRLKWLSANVFRDDELDKASYYAFTPKSWWSYDWANAKCVLSNTALGSNFKTRIQTVGTLLDNLIGYDDIGTITGDILKAYKQENCEKLEVMNLGEVLIPTIDHEAIDQIRNGVIIRGSSDITYELKQVNASTQLLQTENSKTGDKGVYFSWPIPDLYQVVDAAQFQVLPRLAIDANDPTPQQIIEQTRFSGVIRAKVTDSSDVRLYIEEPGSEVLVSLQYYYFDEGGALFNVPLDTIAIYADPMTSELMDATKVEVVAQQVSGTPTHYYFIIDSNSSTVSVRAFTWGKNVQVLGSDVISNLNKGCVLSEWTMPMFKLLETN